MKKKWYLIIFMALFLLAVGAFHYDGTQSKKTATQESSDTLVGDQHEELISEAGVPILDDSELEDEEENSREVTLEIETGEKTKEETNTKSDNVLKQEKVIVEEYTNQNEEEIIINGKIYTLTMDEEKYSNLLHLIIPAKNNGAKLYGIYKEDFIIVKDGKPIAYIFLGEKRVLVNHADMVKEMFTQENYNIGIKDNIDFVIKTGATVSVEWEHYIGYHISIKGDWLTVHHD
ncbi:hypothetical protein [Bacillus sp. FJAT-50079]|uniref:hypothetical protein n=1 Tax=Bacillus sp. FJAT-50079 TaxID=2833577 RepID=UPI001BC8ECEF|nr:hypothetical protein [Bacillus sp. FJAT-50079]MBS4206745.1 hypothetical protein [Bacillus sp. FJAT-50079]